MARVVRFHETGRPQVLQIEGIDLPKLGLGEVQMRIHALGLNRAEAMFRSGQYVQESKLPGRPGYEATGIIEAIGEGVEDRAAARQGAGCERGHAVSPRGPYSG